MVWSLTPGTAVLMSARRNVVLRLERPAGHRRVSEQQPVQVQDQAGVQRAPVLLEQVVLGVAVAGQLLFAAVAQRRRLPVDDASAATLLTISCSRWWSRSLRRRSSCQPGASWCRR